MGNPVENILQQKEDVQTPTDNDATAGERDAEEENIAESEGDPIDEAAVVMSIIAQSITSLLRIGILVRKATPRDKFKEALRATRIPFPDTHYTEYVRHKHTKLTQMQYTRLGRAIANRRQFIIYCRGHRARLGYEETEDDRADARTAALPSKASTFHASIRDSLQDEEEEDGAISVMSASRVSDVSQSLKLPLLADLSPNDEPFECPICFTLQSFKGEKTWQ
jgi:hypothetical protein